MCLDAYFPFFLSGYWTGRLSGPQNIGKKNSALSIESRVQSFFFAIFWGPDKRPVQPDKDNVFFLDSLTGRNEGT